MAISQHNMLLSGQQMVPRSSAAALLGNSSCYKHQNTQTSKQHQHHVRMFAQQVGVQQYQGYRPAAAGYKRDQSCRDEAGGHVIANVKHMPQSAAYSMHQGRPQWRMGLGITSHASSEAQWSQWCLGRDEGRGGRKTEHRGVHTCACVWGGAWCYLLCRPPPCPR